MTQCKVSGTIENQNDVYRQLSKINKMIEGGNLKVLNFQNIYYQISPISWPARSLLLPIWVGNFKLFKILVA